MGRIAIVLLLAAACGRAAEPLLRLKVLDDRWPRAFFFRVSESLARDAQISFEDWEAEVGRLMGIEGKALDEEIPGTSARNIEFFTRFKRRHPEQLVLLHFNGTSRLPDYRMERYFAGHWLYYNGARVLADVAASAGETDIRVDDAWLFAVNTGRGERANDDVALCALDAAGKPDWNRCEQTHLLSIDTANRVIRVARGQYGTKPLAFAAGKAYAAAHVSDGPWSGRRVLHWQYNYSTASPRDRAGRSCADVLAAELRDVFAPGGELAAFDGIEFDVMRHYMRQQAGGRGVDADGDGAIDSAMFGGLPTYGIGTVEFCRQVRRMLGAGKLVLADGHFGSQRAFGVLNGIESEGWPAGDDFSLRDWSGGLNRHLFWNRNAFTPQFSYINHKYKDPREKIGYANAPGVPMKVHRLVFAAAAITGTAVCYTFAPPAEPGKRVGVWDELREPGWLGRPLGPAVRLAERRPNLVKGAPRFTGKDVTFTREGGAIRIECTNPKAARVRFHLTVPLEGPDLYVAFTARAAPMRGYPAEVARRVSVSADAAGRPLESWAGASPFRSAFYFPEIKGPAALEISVEGVETVWVSDFAAHAWPDAMYREFERGVVLANPAEHPYRLDLAQLFPGRRFRRLEGSPLQDPHANNGSPVGEALELQPKEGLFLRSALPAVPPRQ